ncbi:MAG TPA: elongation factor P [Bacilli bacterium]|jgi:elongation factor P|nr:MAG: Elongation factor P [Tenericutes bacterium ADurb.Bin140]HOE77407.1 elongation factor P [Bacilli bacterium]HON63394.1 elongation factor P [Bacilli bacterium]HOR95295.1 elongation factor P [Bacilli bacterium]HPD12156.1 elongation factor P [Bacilli bacterium]
MISTSDFKTGLNILYNNNLYQIMEFQHVKPGKGQAFVRTKLRNLRTGAIFEYSFNAGEKMEIAQIEKKKMQFSYTTTDTYCFMDMETFEQVELPSERLKWESNFLLEGMEVEIVCYGSEILGINLPEKVVLEVVESAPAVAGNTATAALKEVKMETGLVVKVPMFVNQGDKLIISTSDGKYSSRA